MMIKRSKKKWKPKRPEVNRVKQAECINQSRNSLGSSNQPSGGRERQSRNLKKMRSPNNRSKCLWHRSKSVPPKTVSFCPYVMHRFAQGPRRVKADVSRSNSCACCKHKAGAKRSIATKKKLAMEKSGPHQHELDPCLPADNAPSAYDQFYGTPCPGYVRCGNDHMCPEFDYHQNEYCGLGPLYHREYSDRSPAPKYHSYLPQEHNPGMSLGTPSSVGSAYVTDVGSNPPPWHPVKRSLHTTPGLRNRGADAKYDFLMAKYSEHNCPKSHPALSDYFSFQRLAKDGSQNVANLSQNKSPSAFLAAATSASFSQPRSHSQTRSEQMTQPGATGQSLFQYDNKYYTGFSALNNYSRGRSFNTDQYQSEAMRDLMYNTVSQKYIDNSTASSQKWYTRADPEMNSVFQRRRLSSTSYPFPETSSAFRSRFGANSLGSRKYEFFDDMSLMRRYHNWGINSMLQSDVLPVKSGVFRRSRSSDAAFEAGLCNNNDDKDTPVHRRFSLDNEGDHMKSNNRQHGTWIGSYEKADNWKSPFGKDELSKGTYGQLDDAISSSKYTDRGGIRRSSGANNSNEKINCLQTDEPILQTNILYGPAWTPLTKRSSRYSDSKSTDNNAFLSRLDEPGSRRLYDKYACWKNARTPIPEHGSRILKDDLKDDDKTCISGQRKDYTSLNLARDKSVSPGVNNKLFSLSRGNFNSFLTANDPPFDGLGKHHSSGLAFDQPPVVSEYKTSKAESNHHFQNYSSLGGRNVNMNKSQSNDAKKDFQPSTATSLYKSWKFHPCGNYSFNTDPAPCGLTKPIGCSGLGSSQAGIQYGTNYFDCSVNMLSSLVDQETDRLRKLAGVIERQHDGSQDVNDDIIF